MPFLSTFSPPISSFPHTFSTSPAESSSSLFPLPGLEFHTFRRRCIGNFTPSPSLSFCVVTVKKKRRGLCCVCRSAVSGDVAETVVQRNIVSDEFKDSDFDEMKGLSQLPAHEGSCNDSGGLSRTRRKSLDLVVFFKNEIGDLGFSPTTDDLIAQVNDFLAKKPTIVANFQNLQENKLLSISDLNNLLIALAKSDSLELAIRAFYELTPQPYSSSGGPIPNSLSFSIIIQCLCKWNKLETAKLILHEMLRKGFSPNSVTFTVLIHSLCKRGKLQKAREVFEEMHKIKCTPTIRTYNSLLNGLCYVGRIDEALKLLRKIEKASSSKATKPDIYTYTTLMDGFCKVGRSDEAMELLEEAIKLGLNPTIVTFNSLLNGYSKEGRPLKGVAVLSQMVSRECRPDIISYTILLLGLLKWAKIPEALLIYKDMMKSGFQPDERVMNTLLRGICKEVTVNDREWLMEAEMVFGKIYEMGFRVSPYTYSLMIQALGRCGEVSRAFSNLLDMFRLGKSPTLMTCNIVMRLLCRDKRIDDAFLVFVLMIESGIVPTVFSCTVLLDQLNQQGRFLDACGVFCTTFKHGIVIDQVPMTVE